MTTSGEGCRDVAASIGAPCRDRMFVARAAANILHEPDQPDLHFFLLGPSSSASRLLIAVLTSSACCFAAILAGLSRWGD
jgi:hypothetical protein